MGSGDSMVATYEDLLALPETTRAERIADRLVIHPPLTPRHQHVLRVLCHVVGGPFDDDDGRGGPGGWCTSVPVDVRLSPHDVVCPDFCGWRRARWTMQWDTRPIDVVPDWICEITSPSNARHDRITKANLYLSAGVSALWLIDPEARVLEALVRDTSNGEPRWIEAGRFGDGDTVRIAPFEAIELEVGRLFPPETPA